MSVNSEEEKKETTEELLDRISKNQNAHVITKINEDFYKTSKVEIPKKDVKSKKLQNCFEQLKRELCYESQKNKVEINYLDINEKYSDKRRQVIQIRIQEESTDPKKHRSISVHDRIFKDIQKTLPKGFVFSNIQTMVHYHAKEESFFYKEDSQSLDVQIDYEKETKKIFGIGGNDK